MRCILKLSDPILIQLLGKGEFNSMDELRETFKKLLDKHPTIPLLIKSGGKTFNKFGKIYSNGDKIQVEVLIPGQEDFDTFKFAIRGKGDVEVEKFGTPNKRILELDGIDSFIAFYLANYLYIDPNHMGSTIEERLREFSIALLGLDYRIKNGHFSYSIQDIRFALHLGEYYNLLKQELIDYPEDATTTIRGEQYSGNIPEIISGLEDLAREHDRSLIQKRQAINKEEFKPVPPPKPIEDQPSGIFFQAYDVDKGEVTTNEVALGRRILIRSLEQGEYRIRLEQGNETHVQSVALTSDQVIGGVVGIIEKWEGEWKPVYLTRTTKIAPDTKAVLTTDPSQAYQFEYELDGEKKKSPQLTLMLSHGKNQGKVYNLKEEFKNNPEKDWHFKIDRVSVEERDQEKTLSELGLSLDRFKIDNSPGTEKSGRIFLISNDKIRYDITRLPLNDKEIEEVLILLEQEYSAEEAKEVATYLNNYIGLGQDIADLSEDPESEWYINKLRSSRVVTFYAQGNRVALLGERKKVGDRFEVEQDQKKQILSESNKDLIRSYLQAASIRIQKGDQGAISLDWVGLKWENGLKTIKVSSKQREKFYLDHIKIAQNIPTSTALVAYRHSFESDEKEVGLSLGSFNYRPGQETTEGEIRQMLSQLKKRFKWDNVQWDLLENLFNTDPSKYRWDTKEDVGINHTEGTPAYYNRETKTIVLNIDSIRKHPQWLLSWILEERIHHVTADKILSKEWRESQEIKNLLDLRSLVLDEWEKVKNNYTSEQRRVIEYRLKPEIGRNDVEGLLEFVTGIGYKGFSDLLDSISYREKSVLQQVKELITKLISKILGQVTGIKKDLITETLNLVYGTPAFEESVPKIIGPKKGGLKKKTFGALPEEMLTYPMVKGLDAEIAQILFDSGKFEKFVNGRLKIGKVTTTLRNEWYEEYNNASPERQRFIYSFMKNEETFKAMMDEWQTKSEFFKVNNSILLANDDENNIEEDIEKPSNEGQFNKWDRTTQEKSSLEEGDKFTRLLIKLTPQYKDGYVYKNGILQLVDYTSFWNRVQDLLKDSYDFNKMMDKLEELSIVNPEVDILRDRLLKLDNTVLAQTVRSSFQRSFGRAFVPTYVVEFRDGKAYLQEQGRIDRQKLEESFNIRFKEFVEERDLEKIITRIVNTPEGEDVIQFPSYDLKGIALDLNETKESFSKMIAFWEDMGLDIPDYLKQDNPEGITFQSNLRTLTKQVVDKLNQLGNYNPEDFDFPRLIKYSQVLGYKEISGLSSFWSVVLNQISKYSEITVSNMTHNAEGNNQSNLHTFSTHTITYQILNEEFAKEEDPEKAIQNAISRGLLRLNNPIFKYSLIGQGISKTNPIQAINLSGSRVFDGESYNGVNTIDLDVTSYLRQELFTMLFHGVKENLRAETANTSLGFQFQYGTVSKDILPVPLKSFRSNDWEGKALKIFSDYLKGEVERIKLELESDYTYYPDYEEVRYNFSLFSFLPVEIKSKWLNEINLSNETPEELAKSFVKDKQKVLKEELFKFLNQGQDEFINWIEKETGIKVDVKHPIFRSQVSSLFKDLGFNQTIKAFYVNSIISNIEHTILSHGELGMFPNFYKRSKSNISVGINSSFTSLYDTLETIKEDTYTQWMTGRPPSYYERQEVPQGKSFVIKDDILNPDKEWINSLEQGVKQSLLQSNKVFGIDKTDEQVSKDAKDKVRKYENTNVSDGGAYMHPDFGRAFLLSLNSWTVEMEEGYRYLLYKSLSSLTPEQSNHIEFVNSRIKKQGIYWAFPIVKAQYRGNSKPLQGEPVSAIEQLDKFALTWLFPVNEKEKSLLEAMTKGDYIYGKFESGSKIGTYIPDNILLELGEKKEPTINSGHLLYLDFLKEQVKTNPELKVKSIFGTQQRKLLVSNLKNDKGYIEGMEEYVGLWKSSQHEIAENQREALFTELGAEDVNNPVINLDRFADLVKKEVDRRDLPESITSIFELFGNEYYKQFESALSPQLVETMLYSLLKNRIVRAKFNGSQLILKPSSLHERLEFYRMVDGKVLPAECKVTLMGDFLNLLNLSEVKEKATELNPNWEEDPYESIDTRREALNILLHDTEFVSKHRNSLIIYSYRIPTQGYNSMEVMIIKEFLPTWDGPHIIAHPQITTKTGGDFDFDKLPTLFPSIFPNGKYRKNQRENILIRQAENILLDPVNFHRLVTPNTTDLIKPPIEKIIQDIKNPQESPKNADIVKPKTHYSKWKAVKIKDLLGIGAVGNTFYSLLQNANSFFYEFFTVNEIRLKNKSALLTSDEKMNLQSPFIVNSDIQKLDYINEFINLTVDAPSDDIAGYTRMTRDNTGLIIIQTMQGVPFDRTLALIHQPIVVKYHQLLNQFIDEGMIISDAKRKVYEELLKIETTRQERDRISNLKNSEVWAQIARLIPDHIPSSFLTKSLTQDKKGFSEKDRQVLAFYLGALEQANAMREVQAYLNFDTSVLNSVLSSTHRENQLDTIISSGVVDIESVNRIKTDSVISHLDVHKEFSTLAAQLFNLKRDPYFVDIAVRMGNDITSANSRETFFRVFDNDFLLSIIQNYGSINKEWVQDQLQGKWLDRWENVKEKVKNTSLYNRLIPSYSPRTNIINPKLWMGLDQSPEEWDHLAQEIRDMINSEDKEVSQFAKDLIKISLFSTGFNQSPVYMLKTFPFEHVAPLIQEAYDNFTFSPEYVQAFWKKFLIERGMQFSKYFLDFYKGRYDVRNITAQWKRDNLRQDAFRFVDYSLSLEEKDMGQLVMEQFLEAEINHGEIYTRERFDNAINDFHVKEYEFLSNFEQLTNPIVDEFGNKYWNSEGYYMALRTNNQKDKRALAEVSEKGGNKVKQFKKTLKLDENESNRIEYMRIAVKAKFDANPDLREKLMATKGKELIEGNYWGDTLFGVSNKTLKGYNALGKALMEYRDGIGLTQVSQGIKFEEHSSSNYADRTRINASADATLAIASDFNSLGELATKKSVRSQGKLYIPIDIDQLQKEGQIDHTVDTIIKHFKKENVKSVNIAGNGIYTFKGKYTQDEVDNIVFEILNKVNEQYPIQSIRSGGQTGVDEAGGKAGLRLGIPTTILAPKGWKFRDISEKDISDEQLFKQRFNIHPSQEINESKNPFEC